METIAVIFFFALAVWYLYRRLLKNLKGGPLSCGCSGCDTCPSGSKTGMKIEQSDEKKLDK
ncbi:hypothetical protein DSCW_39240 [Desulfosarcina widdelii]|uniref:FeoB-associated Cys-rich membrane protein n=1 Tax=Desulfosarcina widdelii TaxID=947919 RepID=A0A5K7ZKE6_9BACT|nr:FeoB-associated Cys-rich membrane protein [Desulfosarcina widdelii]BBO76507.1 hypothetical protein DSCW_39240 [Desulfosarcina widdelii]